VGADVKGEPVVRASYGLANLEHDVPFAIDTIASPGSVAKQFTAAAVLLLARDGKLALDDPALTPVYADAFRGDLGWITFEREASGRVSRLNVSQDRMWRLSFDRR
jgi:CubicO group peptidase (beta-lactamase class C family)